MNRRRFLSIAVLGLAMLAVPALRILRPVLPRRWVRALRGRYPGKIVKLDPASIRKPSTWRG
jgi:hypothetical protein